MLQPLLLEGLQQRCWAHCCGWAAGTLGRPPGYGWVAEWERQGSGVVQGSRPEVVAQHPLQLLWPTALAEIDQQTAVAHVPCYCAV